MFLNLVALSALALLACEHVNGVALDSGHLHARHDHAVLAKRTFNKRCKPRPAAAKVAPATPQPPQSTPVANNPAPSNSGAKAALAWSVYDGDDVAKQVLANFKTSHVSGLYNWSPNKVTGADEAGYEFYPMLWGNREGDVPNFKSAVTQGYARYALGFNEPDHERQANLDAVTAAQLWNEHMRPLKALGYTLVSPAVTSNPESLKWMQRFIDACGGGCVDRIALHWYGVNFNEFQTYVETWHNTFNLDIWVTEFGCRDYVNGRQCTADEFNAFAGNARAFLDSAAYVEKYFPFAIQRDMSEFGPGSQLLGPDNRPTDLAWKYFG